MHSLIHAISLDRRSCAPESVRAEDASQRGKDDTARTDTEIGGATAESAARPLSRRIRSRRVQRVEHALFAVVLVTVGYVYLGALLMDAL